MISNNIKKAQIRKNTEEYANQMAHYEEERKAEVERIKKEEEEKLSNKYKPLTESDIEKIDNIYGHQDNKRVFLTFDDGPTNEVTPFILDLLKKENIKANFFLLGSRVENLPELVKREFDEGHFIGNHSYTHRYNDLYQSVDTVLDEYNKTNDLIKNAVQDNRFNSLLFRFPGGLAGGKYASIKQEAALSLKENGIANVDWNALTNDANGAKTKEALLESFYSTIANKSSIVLLMHDASDKILTYEVLPEIISYLRENGYTFQTFFDAIDR